MEDDDVLQPRAPPAAGLESAVERFGRRCEFPFVLLFPVLWDRSRRGDQSRPAGDFEPSDLRHESQVGQDLLDPEGSGGREQQRLLLEEPRPVEDVAEPVVKDLKKPETFIP